MIYQTSPSRKDASLVCFSGTDNDALLKAICSNSATGYVRQKLPGGSVIVPKRSATAVAAHLDRLGWSAA